jgi:hypothetical protein
MEGLATKDVGIFMTILSSLRPNGIPILWPFGTFCGYVFGIFFPVLVPMLHREKSGNPDDN